MIHYLGMLVLKTVPLLDVKESPDEFFFGWSLYTNLLDLVWSILDMKIDTLIKMPTGTVPSTRDLHCT